MNDWLTGIGLLCNIAGALLMFFFGVPTYPRRDLAGKGVLVLEQEEASERRRVERADWLSRGGVVLLLIGFAVQFAALFN